MSDPPESWPNEPREHEGSEETAAPRQAVAPLFPLAGVWLHPGVILPLHVFEPRYRQLVEDLLDGPGRIVLGTVLPGHEGELEGAPPCYEVAGLGEIGRHERLPDGRFNIWLFGLARVHIEERESDRMYRKVLAKFLSETAEPDDEREALFEQLLGAIEERSPVSLNIPRKTPVARMTDLLLMHLPLEPELRNELFSELDVASRARRSLQEHREREIPDPQEGGGEEPGFTSWAEDIDPD